MKKLLVAVSVSMLAAINTNADTVNGIDPYAAGFGFDTPAEAGLAWQRGDVDTLYAEWDVFSRVPANADFTYTHAPDIAQAGDTAYIRTTPSIVSGSQNLYAFGGDHAVNLSVDTHNFSNAGKRQVVLQIETVGATIKAGTFTIGSNAADTITETYAGTTQSSFGEVGLNSWMLVWNDIDVADLDNFNITGKSTVHSSLTQIALDIGPATSEVPVPAAAWLFGSALVGLLAKRNH